MLSPVSYTHLDVYKRQTLGRIMNVLGEPVDMKGEIGEEERWAIHRAAPSYEELSNSQELLDVYKRQPKNRIVCLLRAQNIV